MSKKKTVLVLEDDPDERRILQSSLERKGFRVGSAANLQAAWKWVEEFGEDLDLVILDIRIAGTRKTGLEFGLEVKERLRNRPPEFLVNTAYPRQHFYSLAFQLGAASYLVKPSDLSEVLGFVRTLVLRRSLLARSLEMTERIKDLARQSTSAAAAISSFCCGALREELAATLGVPFLLLVGEGEGALNFGHGIEGLPESSPAYGLLQRLSHLLQTSAEPLIVESGLVPNELPERATCLEVFGQLEGAAFIPLVNREELKVSLGLVHRNPSSALGKAEDFARILGTYFQPILSRFLADLSETWALYAEQRSVLDAAAEFCLYVGQEETRLIEKLLRSAPSLSDPTPPELQRLQALGENLRNAGEVLSLIGRPAVEGSAEEARGASSMAALVREVWSEISEELGVTAHAVLEIEGDCQVPARADNLEIAIARILRWLTQRLGETPADLEPALAVHCLPQEGGVEIDFRDHSRRLPRLVRTRLFSQASAPPELLDLYLSKVLVERERGVLEDRSDDLEGGAGNRFVMCFPRRRVHGAASA